MNANAKLRKLVRSLAAPRPPIVHERVFRDPGEPGRKRNWEAWATAHPWKKSALAKK